MKLSPSTRYYVHQLLRQKSSVLTIDVEGACFLVNPTSSLDNIELEDIASELEILVNLHKRLKEEGQFSRDQLIELERQIFSLLGLQANFATYTSLLNQLSELAKKYLGPSLIIKYWKTTQPTNDEFEKFEITKSGKIIFQGSANSFLSFEQQQKMSYWIQAFISRCSLIIRNFTQLLYQEGLTQKLEKTHKTGLIPLYQKSSN